MEGILVVIWLYQKNQPIEKQITTNIPSIKNPIHFRIGFQVLGIAISICYAFDFYPKHHVKHVSPHPKISVIQL